LQNNYNKNRPLQNYCYNQKLFTEPEKFPYSKSSLGYFPLQFLVRPSLQKEHWPPEVLPGQNMEDDDSSMDTDKYQGKPPSGLRHFFDQMQKFSGLPTWSHEEEHEGAHSAHPGERRQTKSLHQARQPLAGRSSQQLEL
jgi:hypothetical protein